MPFLITNLSACVFAAEIDHVRPAPLSLLNDYLYCPRRAGLKINDGLRGANGHTLRGDLNHEHADLPGFEHLAGWKIPRLPRRLGA
jgi:hypothetical protein